MIDQINLLLIGVNVEVIAAKVHTHSQREGNILCHVVQYAWAKM